jgi:hypothetical protein
VTQDHIKKSVVVGVRSHFVEAGGSVGTQCLKSMHAVQVAQQIRPKDDTAAYWEYILGNLA